MTAHTGILLRTIRHAINYNYYDMIEAVEYSRAMDRAMDRVAKARSHEPYPRASLASCLAAGQTFVIMASRLEDMAARAVEPTKEQEFRIELPF